MVYQDHTLAAYAVKHLLNVESVIPSHTIPTKETAPQPETLENLLDAFPVVQSMMGRDDELLNELTRSNTKVLVLGYGEEVEL